MKKILLVITILMNQICYSQIPKGIFRAKEWSKSIALYKAKIFVMRDVLGITADLIKFEIDPLAATNSGELTTLVYKCAAKNKEGLVLGFFGDYWNESGVTFTGYAFKEFPKFKAIKLLEKIKSVIKDNHKYFELEYDVDNIYFQEEDMVFLIYYSNTNYAKIRVFWNGFDAEWDASALNKTLNKMQKALD